MKKPLLYKHHRCPNAGQRRKRSCSTETNNQPSLQLKLLLCCPGGRTSGVLRTEMGFNRTSSTEIFKQPRHHQASFRGDQGVKRCKRFANNRGFPGKGLLFRLYSPMARLVPSSRHTPLGRRQPAEAVRRMIAGGSHRNNQAGPSTGFGIVHFAR